MARPICLGLLISKEIVSDIPKIPKGSKDSENTKSHKTIVGVVGGYCGSGLFHLEQFVWNMTQTTDKTTCKPNSLWVGSTDILTGEEIDFNTLPHSTLEICQKALDECWEWNSENNYLESQQLRLYPYNIDGLTKSGSPDHLYHKKMKEELKPIWKSLHQSLLFVPKSQNIPTIKSPKSPKKTEKYNSIA